ncbi:MAG TPA: sugar nucleotide-binding protein, partial [Solirubrobacteraceae bacterium]
LWHATPAQVPGVSASTVDLNDRRACAAAASGFEPDVIVHAAAVGDPGRFEHRPALSELALRGVEHTLAAARAVRARYVLVSCDWVFSGLRPPGESWEETDAVEPVNTYGRALAAAEALVRDAEVDWLIVRPGDPYGVNLSRPLERRDLVRGHRARRHAERRRELTGVRRQGELAEHVWGRSGEAVRILARLREARLPLPAPADVRRSPTYAWDGAQRLCELIAQDRTGVYHLGGQDCMHRREYVRAIAHAFGCVPTLAVDGDIPAYLDALGEPAELTLPPNTALDSGRARAALGHPAVDIEAGLWLMGDQLRRALAR